MWTQQKNVIKVTDKRHKSQSDQLIIEKELIIKLNNKTITTLTISASAIKECAVGYLLCHHHIGTEIESIEESPNTIHVIAPTTPVTFPSQTTLQNPSSLNIFQLTAYFQESALLFKQTAISESAALAHKNTLICAHEDIYQHNALYKSIGHALLNKNLDFHTYSLLISSKIDSHFMTIAKPFHFPFIISRTAPTHQGLEIATQDKTVIIGFARGKRFNLYNHN